MYPAVRSAETGRVDAAAARVAQQLVRIKRTIWLSTSSTGISNAAYPVASPVRITVLPSILMLQLLVFRAEAVRSTGKGQSIQLAASVTVALPPVASVLPFTS